MSFNGWPAVCAALRKRVVEEERKKGRDQHLNEGQRRALTAIAVRLEGGAQNACRGVVIADEVGMGKTRLAVAVTKAVVEAGGRVAIAVPGGLGYQWAKELGSDGVVAPELLRSLGGYLGANRPGGEPPWHRRDVVLISQYFPNWRIGKSSTAGRWRVLPSLVAERRKQLGGNYPQGYGAWRNWNVSRAAVQILAALEGRAEPLAELDDLAKERWKDLDRSARYNRDAWDLGEGFERAIGLGLGRFHLVVIDEAHKGKGTYSMVSRLLGNIIGRHPGAARLGLTATPVALDVSEWPDSLRRVGVDAATLKHVAIVAATYDKATRLLQGSWRTNASAREEWKVAARAFESALCPYVLRRDKREDPGVQKYGERTKNVDGYRRVCELALDPTDLEPDWKRIVIASEAVSATVHGREDILGKRLRLTLANGHGIATLIGAASEQRVESDLNLDTGVNPRRKARAECWRNLLLDQLASTDDDALLHHPQICLAADFIGKQLDQKHKVLVFGRFTRPLHALTRLVNSRARVRALVDDTMEPWPRKDPWSDPRNERVDRVTAEQLGVSDRLHAGIEKQAKRYEEAQQRRKWLYKRVLDLIERGLRRDGAAPLWAARLLAAIDQSDGALVGRSCWELLTDRQRQLARKRKDGRALQNGLATAFVRLARAALDDDPFGEEDSEKAGPMWHTMRSRLGHEFSPQRRGIARDLDGGVGTATRRLLQAAFNRDHSWPRVLMAQSSVGREGLNLHEACRIVLLLHPEWNPGVVEQQIGRVDRIGSRWHKDLEAAGDGPLPQIEVRAVIFKGTYDEHNWKVLNRRWAALRAQLHGIVVPLSEVKDPRYLQLARDLNDDAPNFKPR